ncbi:hypothetical protein [Lacticaseibacillus brantae]|uniref:Uncharacterized protein n=1 Tax=Lacticaseibacillus brantae DSM 23927 TaxID=1423727 RepID=A0A0R2AWW1_9LACO|nr:hypothetical protein [Lacticaseibacillus brantae]KRM71934.1 hypothetical protein FC34_GL000914 [Lacticaseibacillus brantae DSM 23927]
MTLLHGLKWTLVSFIVITFALLLTNLATFGILMLVLDAIFAGVYLMYKNDLDRRQMHKMNLIR